MLLPLKMISISVCHFLKTVFKLLHLHVVCPNTRSFSLIYIGVSFLLIYFSSMFLFFPFIFILRIVLQLLSIVLNLFIIKNCIIPFYTLYKRQIQFDCTLCSFLNFFPLTSSCLSIYKLVIKQVRY